AATGGRIRSDGAKPTSPIVPGGVEDEDDEDAELDEDGNPIPVPDDEKDAVAAWPRAVDAQLASCKGDRMKAVQKVDRVHPGLRQRYIKQYNRRTQLAQAKRSRRW
ncbi:MAG TPA: hypothetical protein VM260_19270, partial [Pirellula sp.]|nr:hypothetical protein [Pirellula sp.]